MQPVKLRQLIAFLASCAAISLTVAIILSATQGLFFPFRWIADYGTRNYGITIDAGSHGTRAHLFEWSGRVEDAKNPLLSPVTVPKEIMVYDPGLPGISTLADNPQNIGPIVLGPLINACAEKLARMKLDPGAIHNTPVFLKATAGMRNTDIDTRDAVMSEIRKFLSNKTLTPFNFNNDWARVISGEEEGVFGWISVNNMLKTLTKLPSDTYGALDLGGASSQITFYPTSTSVLEDFYQLKLGERIIRLYSHSFLGYGWGDAQMRVSTRLALEAVFTRLNSVGDWTDKPVAETILAGEVPGIVVTEKPKWKNLHVLNAVAVEKPIAEITTEHPCFPLNYRITFDVPSVVYPDGRFFLDLDARAILAYLNALGMNLEDSSLLNLFDADVIQEVRNQPVLSSYMTPVMAETLKDLRKFGGDWVDDMVDSAYARPFRPTTQLLPPSKLQFRVRFVGSGNFTQCQMRAKELFYQEPCFLSTCSFNGVYQPRMVESKFLALGQYAKVRQALDIPTTATPNTIARKAAQVCQSEWNVLRMNHKSGKYRPFGKNGIANLCWKAIWVHTTLTTGYRFDGESTAVTFYDLDSEVSNGRPARKPKESPAWALGAMVSEISMFPWQSAFGRYKAPFWWAFASSLILAVMTLCQHFKIRHLREKMSPRGLRSDVYHEFQSHIIEESPSAD